MNQVWLYLVLIAHDLITWPKALQLRAGVRSLAPTDQPRARWPAR